MMSPAGAAPSPPKILIVDDHTSVRDSLCDWLGLNFPDYEFLEAEDGEEAIRVAAEHAPLLVLMDIGLPGISGLEAARAILTRHPAIKVVMLSIHDESRYRADARNIGASAFVSKVDMPAGLIPAIVNALASQN